MPPVSPEHNSLAICISVLIGYNSYIKFGVCFCRTCQKQIKLSRAAASLAVYLFLSVYPPPHTPCTWAKENDIRVLIIIRDGGRAERAEAQAFPVWTHCSRLALQTSCTRVRESLCKLGFCSKWEKSKQSKDILHAADLQNTLCCFSFPCTCVSFVCFWLPGAFVYCDYWTFGQQLWSV